MKKHLVSLIILCSCLVLGITAFLTYAFVWEWFNASPSSLIVSELIPQDQDHIGHPLSSTSCAVTNASGRLSIYHALTSGRKEVSPSEAPSYFIVQTTMNNGNTSLFRVWIDPDSQRAWASNISANIINPSDNTDNTPHEDDTYLLTEKATRALLKQHAFQGTYMSAVWPLAAHLSLSSDSGSASHSNSASAPVPLYGQSIDLRRTLAPQKKNLSFSRTHATHPPDIVTVHDLSRLTLLAPESADTTSLAYYALEVGDLESAAAGTLDLAGRPSIQPEQSGHYIAVYTLTYGAKDPSYHGSVTGTFLMSLTSGVHPFTSHTAYPQGALGCIVLTHTGSPQTYDYKLQIPFLDEEIPFFFSGSDTLAASDTTPATADSATADFATVYFPIANTVQPGSYTAKILVQTHIPSPQGSRESAWSEIASTTFTVEKKTFTRQDMAASTEMVSLAIPENYSFDREKTTAAKAQSHPNPYWKGAFTMPNQGRLSTYYGEARYTNGVFSSSHNAVDIADDEDTPVTAAAPGKVVLSFPLRISGNTVIIDHGANIFTSYSHLNACHVKVGDMIQTGDMIGLIGSTGYSTGPHLHFSASQGDIPFDPLWLMDQNIREKALRRAQEGQ
ncbi:MAG: M23 family metallopeptidase [Peptococcaceae bacterium]|nr:M23 family metallopeptidase [Peptococcaceae bacterium]